MAAIIVLLVAAVRLLGTSGEGAAVSAPPAASSAVKMPRAIELPGRPGSRTGITDSEGDEGASVGLPPSTVFRVLTQDNTPIEGALIFMTQGDALVLAGETGPDGMSSVAPSRDEFRVTADGYATGNLVLPVPPPEVCTVHLELELTIEGVVLLPNGSAAGPGVAVMAWKQTKMVDFVPRGRLAFEEHPGIPNTRTDAAGRFRLGSLDRGPYAVAAGGAGYLSRMPTAGLRAPYSTLTLRIHPAYAAVLAVVNEEGEAPGIPWEQRTLSVELAEYDGSVVPADWDFLALSGSDYGVLTADRNAFPYVVTADEEADSVGPFRITARYAGYEPLEELFRVPRSVPVAPELRFEVRRIAEGFGVLRVDFSGIDASLLDGVSLVGAVLHLASADGRAIRVGLPDGGLGGLDIPEIPVGTYTAALFFDYCGTSLQANDGALVRVDQGTKANALFDLSGTRALSIEVLHPDGSEYFGPLSFTCVAGSEAEGGVVGAVSFDRAPYVLPGFSEKSVTLLRIRPGCTVRGVEVQLGDAGVAPTRLVIAAR